MTATHKQFFALVAAATNFFSLKCYTTNVGKAKVKDAKNE